MRMRIVTEFRKNKLPYILIIPFVIFLIFTYLIPIFRGLYITFFSYPSEDLSRAFIPVDYSQDPLLWTIHALLGGLQFQDPIFVGVDNFLELFSHTSRAGSFQKALNNNIFFVIIFVPSVIVFSLFLAVVLNNKFLKGEDAYTTIFYMPVITSILVVSVIWLRVVFDPDSGFLTLLMQILTPLIDLFFIILNIITLGLIPANSVAENINWLSQYLMESVAGMTIWRRVGFDVLILLAGLKSIPDSLYEAAEIDGHGAWSKFKNITLPMLKGPLGVVIILELINGWLVFQELYGLNVAGSDVTLAIYLIYNYADPRIMTFASTVGYFIFAMSAFLSLIDKTEVRGILKAYVITCLLAILFSIPSNRQNTDPKGLGLTIEWLSYDIFFMAISFFILTYYLIFIVIKNREIEQDLIGLRNIGVFTLFTSILYLLNGYNSFSISGFGVTEFGIGTFPSVPILMLGALPLFIGLFLLLLNRYPSVKEKTKLVFSLIWGFSILIAFSLISLEIIFSLIRFVELHAGEKLEFYLDLIRVANGVLRGSNTMLVGIAIIWIILALLVIRGLYRPTTHFATLSLILGSIVMFIGLLPTFFTLFSIILSSYLIGVILVIVGLMMVFAHKYVPIVKSSDESHSIIAFGSLILIFANIGWFFFVPFSAIAGHELVSIIFVGITMFIDIIGFAIFSTGILKSKNENQLAVKGAGFCYLGWALVTFIWRLLSPILFIPQVGSFSLDLGLITSNMALIMLNNIIISILFILSGILLLIGTLLTEKIYEGSPRFLLPYSILNLLGILLITLPLFIGVELGILNILFIS
ncbi:MAG: carbohydrate ABC transporter permease, partial [Candidatus Hodarchaeales archaeon]